MKTCVRGPVGCWVQFVMFWSTTSTMQKTVWQSVMGKLVEIRFEPVMVNFKMT